MNGWHGAGRLSGFFMEKEDEQADQETIKSRFAKADDPIYKEGWTITTRAWGRLPKPDPQLAEAVRKAGKNTGES